MSDSPSNVQPTKVGFIGLGAMGTGMARNLAKAGLLTSVWNRSPQSADSIAAATGCAIASDPAELARNCDVVVMCVSADRDVLAVSEAMLPGVSAGQAVIDCSTVSAETARKVAGRFGEQGVDFLDAPVSGGTEGASNGTLTIMVGGNAEAFERLQPVFAAFGKRIERMGPVGAGQATKAVNQIMAAGINQAVCEALAFAEQHNLPVDRVIDVVGSGAAGNWFVNHRGKTMTRGDFAPGFRMALHHKDLAICLAMAAEAGITLPLTAETLADYQRLMGEGHGDDDISGLYRRYREDSK